MVTTQIDICFVVEMTNIETGEITTFPMAYQAKKDAESFVLLCKSMDKDLYLSELRTYQIKRFSYYR